MPWRTEIAYLSGTRDDFSNPVFPKCSLQSTRFRVYFPKKLLIGCYDKSLWSCLTLSNPVVHQALLSTGFSRQEYWSGLPWPPPDPGIKPVSLTPPALAGGFFTTSFTWEALCLMLELQIHRGFPGSTNGKEPTCWCRRHKRWGFNPWVRKIPWRRAWQPNPVDRGPWWAMVHGVAKNWTWLKWLSMHKFTGQAVKRRGWWWSRGGRADWNPQA